MELKITLQHTHKDVQRVAVLGLNSVSSSLKDVRREFNKGLHNQSNNHDEGLDLFCPLKWKWSCIMIRSLIYLKRIRPEH